MKLLKLIFGLSVCFFFMGCAISPKPLTQAQIEMRVAQDIKEIFTEQEPVDAPISIYEAMARTLKYNLDHRLKLMEQALSNRQLNVAQYDLLPQLTASAGYTHRNNHKGSSSTALTGPNAGQESLVTSTSENRDLRTGDVTMMWNVLDFGVSYVKARQQADRSLIVEERRRKVIQNLFQDVRYAYWLAASADYLLPEMNQLLNRSRSALERLRKIFDQRLAPPIKTLEDERVLLENIRLLWELIRKLKPAKKHLASMMSYHPGATFKLVSIDTDQMAIPAIPMSLPVLEESALTMRPELREEDYRARISAWEVKKEILNMLPGIRLDVGYNYDSNSFLFNNDWFSVGTRISYELFGLISGPATLRAAKTKQEVDRLRRQALSIAVITQVHLAYERYTLMKEEYKIARRLFEINRELNEQMAVAQKLGKEDEQTQIRGDTRALVATMRNFLAYADLQDAEGRLYQSLGLDFLPETIDSLDVRTLAQAIEDMFARELKKLNPTETSSCDGCNPFETAQQIPNVRISYGNEPMHMEELKNDAIDSAVSTDNQITPTELVAFPLYKKVGR